MFKNMKQLFITFINILVVLILLMVFGGFVTLNAILITSIINEWRLTGYLDLTFGFSVVSVYFLMVWVPIWITRYTSTVRRAK